MEDAIICGEGLWSQGFGEAHSLRPEPLKRSHALLMVYRAFGVPSSHFVEPHLVTREKLLQVDLPFNDSVNGQVGWLNERRTL
jgi:hypothetical protein